VHSNFILHIFPMLLFVVPSFNSLCSRQFACKGVHFSKSHRNRYLDNNFWCSKSSHMMW
jgi:hypothetical protein